MYSDFRSFYILWRALRNVKKTLTTELNQSYMWTFLHSNFARLMKKSCGKIFYEKNLIWKHESANKNHLQFVCKFLFKYFLLLYKRIFVIHFNVEMKFKYMKRKTEFMLVKKLKNMKINCNVDELMIIAKKITKFNVFFFSL